MQEEIKVSVYCLAYNHGSYIRKTLEGFVTQKTNFPFQVIVHDDASTDDTAAIIAEFAEKYPEIIKPIYQTENQYSKQTGIMKTFILPRLKGNYVAVCEGDDYWCSPDKLQKQADILDAHPECVMVCHNTDKITADGRYLDCMIKDLASGYLAPEGLIHKGNKNPHLSSIMCRIELFREERPEFFKLTTGDNAHRLFALTKGKIYYIDEVMSVYRTFTPGGWTDKQRNDQALRIQTAQNTISFLSQYDAYTLGKYHDAVEQEKLKRTFSLKMAQEDYKEAYKLSKKIQTAKKVKVYLFLVNKFPFIAKLKKN